jgi:5-methyltetrahydropteroyltriglutamate--homocysteine methyltransferase
MALSHNLGFPRIGARRELKQATEAYWRGERSREELLQTAAELRRRHWLLQRDAGIDLIPSNDFSLYDHVLDTCALVGAVPERYRWAGERVDLETYFTMARGSQRDGLDVTAMEMTKWFDTNYHYIVPELTPEMSFRLATRKPLEEFREALAMGIRTRPVLLGPLTFLLLGKPRGAHAEGWNRLSLLDPLLRVYETLLAELADAGAEWVQLDEPCLVQDRTAEERAASIRAYDRLSRAAPRLRLLLATYFEGLGENLATALSLPVQAIHLDVAHAPERLDAALDALPAEKMLSLGTIDGRNIWKTDLSQALALLERARQRLGSERLLVAPSCSLMHVPIDLDQETRLDAEIRSWLAFATQKLGEVVLLTRALNEGRESTTRALEENAQALAARRASSRIHNPEVQARRQAVTEAMQRRGRPFPERRERQREHLRLPLFPTTTIGSFPQTAEVRAARGRFRRGELSAEAYEAFLREEIRRTIALQEEIALDVLVHGEFERNDMVEYFGEQLAGFAFTEHGWVQSYGSRYVKPPIIFGDVKRPQPMTTRWSTYAQSLTGRPVKGMLTGPVTILQWSFVRDDQPREETARQIALAIRDEVADLEAAGIRVIQIDEPAFREGLPLRRSGWGRYLEWAGAAFRLAASGVRDETQIHTHMCYSEFNDILEAIAAMDADVITLESSRSQMELLDAFARYHYPNEIGPGVYDVHAPRVPPIEEMVALLRRACQFLAPEQLWVNPDCGLKTRGWEETVPALRNMVEAARVMRRARTIETGG